MGFLRGKKKSQSTSESTSNSSNRAYDFLEQSYSPIVNQGAQVNSTISDLLGLNGGGNGFENYLNSTGYNFMMDQGSNAITNNRAAQGLLNSGSTLKSLNNYGQNMGNQYFNQYLAQLTGLQGSSDKAAAILAGAGNVSNANSSSQSTSTEKEGLGSFIGSMVSAAAASDRRLKKDIEKVGELRNGLNVYKFTYINGNGPHIGVMVDEVKEIQPEALGPVVDGYGTVDYSKLEKVA